jgi:putative tryptophan/tyrosine transport system substrate-binding protein
MRRREIILVLLGGAMIASPRAGARAQQKAMPVVALLHFASLGPFAYQVDALRQGLAENGYVDGKNVVVESRWAEGHLERLPALAADLVAAKVDVIVAAGGPPAKAAKNATSTIPIVFTDVGDPVGFGLVASLARPGGNLTGFSNLTVELEPKQIELLCELVPQATVITLLVNPDNPMVDKHIRTTQEGERAKGIKFEVLKPRTEAEIDAAFEQLQAGALLVAADSFFNTRRAQLVALAAQHAVPTIYSGPAWVSAGGLISYGTDTDALFRLAGNYAVRILKGEKPADLPVPQPTTFKLVVNLTTAKALGLTVPPSILARADEVIE